MKRKPNYLKHLLQWGVLLSIIATVLWAAFSDTAVDVEKYCPFGGLQAFGTYLVNNSLACSMSMLQIMMGIMLAVGVILFSKLFCGYVCPLGTVGEWLGKAGRKMHLQVTIRPGTIVDRLLRVLKYALLYTILYFTLSSSELFCKRFDPYYAFATGFNGELVIWMSILSIAVFILGAIFIKMFWCKYICPLGAISNIFKFTGVFIAAGLACWILARMGIEGAWVWVIAAACAICYLSEMILLRTYVFPLLVIERDNTACNGCGLCEKKCPYDIPICDYNKVKHVDCTLCGNCVSSCATGALEVGGRRWLRWAPALLTVLLFALAVWIGNNYELPTIDEKWGNYEQVEDMQVFKQDGLQTVKCYGSAKAFSAKMQAVPGVYGVKVFVNRFGVEVSYDPKATDTLKIQESIFTPTQRKFKTPTEDMPDVAVLRLGVEGLHDKMDISHFGMVLQQMEGVLGFTAEFACPVKVTIYVDPAAGFTEDQFEDAIEADALIVKTKEGEKSIPINYVLKGYAADGTISRAEFITTMFRDVEKLSGKFLANIEKWGDDTLYPKAVYEMSFPAVEKLPIRMGVPYFKSFLSCSDGIVSVDFVLCDLVPTMRIHYVKSMWDDERIWNEIFQAPMWTLRMADGTFKEAEPRLKFTTPGKTVEQVGVEIL